MSKFLILKDIHFRFGFKVPAGRTEDFESQIDKKIAFVVEYAKSNNIEGLILTGDSFDKKTPSHYGLEQVRLNLEKLRKLCSPFKYAFDIAGNHSLPFSSREKKSISLYQLAVDSGIVIDLGASKTSQFSSNFKIIGIDFTSDESLFKSELDAKLSSLRGEPSIIVVHEHLFPRGDSMEGSFIKGFTYRQFLDTFNVPRGSTIVAGHLHRGFPTEVVDEVAFVNCWNMTRLARSYYSLSGEHKPEFVVLTLRDSGEFLSAEHIEIPHDDFKSAFVESEIRVEETERMDISSFVNNLEVGVGGESVGSDLGSLKFEVREIVEEYLQRAEV